MVGIARIQEMHGAMFDRHTARQNMALATVKAKACQAIMMLYHNESDARLL